MRAIGTALFLMLFGCGGAPTVIDGSSPEAFAETTESARRDLSVKDRLDFDAALRSPPGKRISDSEAEAAELARSTYDGMTAAEVVELNR